MGASSGPGQPLNVAEELTGLTMAIISETMFGAQLDADTHAVSHAIGLLLADINFRFQVPFYPSLRWPTLRNRRALAAMRVVDDVVLGMIEQRRRSGTRDASPRSAAERDDLLGMLMEARDEDTGEGMIDKQVRDEVVTIFVAGHETTAVALTWVFYLLSQHPDVEAKLHAELDQVLAGRTPTAMDFSNLSYTRKVIDETLRLTRRSGSPTARPWQRTWCAVTPSRPAPWWASARMSCITCRPTGPSRSVSSRSVSILQRRTNGRVSPTCPSAAVHTSVSATASH